MMWFAAAVLFGAVILHRLAELPAWPWTLVIVLALLLALRPSLRVPSGFLLGFALAGLHGQGWIERVVPEPLAGTEVTVIGTVRGIPDHSPRRTRFVFHVHEIVEAPSEFQATRLRVTGFPADPRLAAGDTLRVTLQLRPPRGLHNRAGFDFGAWLYREGMHGLASVRGTPQWLEPRQRRWHIPDPHPLREAVRDAMARAHPQARHPGVMQALVIGERGAMQPEEWRIFLHTGTNHLMAISGLHVGLVAGFALLLARWGWRHGRWLRRRIPLALFGGLSAMAAATLYAGLAGFSIPTQRALIMLLLITTAALLQRDPLSWRIYSGALLAVLVLSPANVLAPGFWFSFGAVAVILLLLQGLVQRPGPTGWLRIQVILALALLPLSLAWFQLGAWVAPLANLLAVPVISFLVLPLLLIGAGFALIGPAFGAPFLWWADTGLAVLLWALEGLLRIPGAATETAVIGFAALLAGVGVMLLLAPRARRGWPWIVLACLPLVLPLGQRLAEGDFRADLLDVGQGLAAIVQTRHHVLVYDAGPAWDGGFDSGRSVVLPALRQQGVRRIDRILVSHEDMDHRGGVAAVAAGLPVERILSRPGVGDGNGDGAEAACEAGLDWTWDGVRFRTLHPPPFWDWGNASSCVLAIHGRHGRLLLTGDVEGLGESVLVHRHVGELDTDVLLVPHHGASGVLSRGLLEAATPGAAWVARGFDNSFGHPSPAVTERLEAQCIPLFDTAERGQLWLETGPGGIRLGPGSRVERRRFWLPPGPLQPPLPASCPESDLGLPARAPSPGSLGTPG